MFSNVLLIAIVVLMFVLLVPVGMAVYQRLRVKPEERGERAPQRRTTVLELVMMISVGLALFVFAVWFFFFAHASLPG